MKCTLMHKRIAAAQMELDEATGFISRITGVLEPEHLPIGVPVRKDIVDRAALNAWRIMQTQKKDNSTSVYRHFVNCCERLGVRKIQQSLDRMLVLDYLIVNEDRHLNNFGLLRNAETLEWLGFASIYDSGSSLGYDKVAVQIRARRDIVCKPFKKQHEEQLKLVTDFDWINFSKLADCGDRITEMLSADGAEAFIGEDRVKAIVSLVENRIENLERIAAKGHREKDEVSTAGDVEKNIAADYIG